MSRLRTANLLGALAAAVANRLEVALKTHPNQNDSAAAALNLIAMFGGCSNVALSRALKLSHPATIRLVDKLEAAGLVETRPGADRRTTALFLTVGGMERAKATLRDRCVALESVVDVLSPEQRDRLDDIAGTLLAALTTSADEAGYICRLCDTVACPEDSCPVHQRALAHLAA